MTFEDAMPSKRMVPAQQLSDAGEDLVRLAAAKDAEIAALKSFCAKAAEVAVTTEKEIAALTEQRDRWKADCEDITTCLTNERQKFMELLNGLTERRDEYKQEAAQLAEYNEDLWLQRNALTEQRDRAMAMVEAARLVQALRYTEGDTLDQFKALDALDVALAALDADAAAETEGQ